MLPFGGYQHDDFLRRASRNKQQLRKYGIRLKDEPIRETGDDSALPYSFRSLGSACWWERDAGLACFDCAG